jgi:hypothetical protein
LSAISASKGRRDGVGVQGKPFPPRPVTRRVETEEPQEAGEAADLETERFAPEPKKPGWLETIAKPEVLAPTGITGLGLPALLESIGEALKGSVPLQIAAAVLVVAVPIGIVAWLVLRQRSVRAGD